MKLFRNSLYLASILFVSGLANAQSTDTTYELHIPAQPLQKALSSLADQTGLQVVYESSLVAGRVSPSVQGKLTTKEALATLLEGTGLRVQTLSDRAIAITDGKATPAEQTKGEASATDPKEEGPAGTGAESDPSGTETVTDLNALVVTGTHIRGVSETGSPILVMSKEAIDRTGYMTVQDVLKTVTANTGGGPSDEASQSSLDQGTNFNAGNSINLRGLGASSTLVLVNGRRQAGGGLEGRFTDISSIPVAAINRIEILTDGASAIYGSDAVGGVVNIILQNDFEGAETRVRLGSADGGADEKLFSQLIGTSWDGGNLMAAYQYSNRSSLAHDERDYAANSDKRPLGGSNFSSYQSSPGNILNPLTGLPAYAIPRGQDGTSLTPGDLLPGIVNYQNAFEGVDLVPTQESNGIFLAGSQKIGDRLTLNGEVRYNERHMERMNIARSQTIRVPKSNPFFVDPFGGSNTVFVSYSFAKDLGARPTFADTRTLTGTFGGTLDLGGEWQLDAYGAYSQEKIRWESRNLVSSPDLAKALADTNPSTAFNPFGDGSFTNPATLDSIRMTQYEKAVTKAWSGNATAQGPLAELPGGKLMLAVGADYRHEYTDRLEAIYRRTGGRIEIDPASVERNVSAGFVELQVPIVGEENSRSGIQRLNLSLAGRYEDYSDFGSTFNPKFGLSWYPTESVQLRGTYGTAFRAPNLQDLNEGSPLSPTSSALIIVRDPKSPTGTSKIVAIAGNNSDLKEETAKTWTTGIDFKPKGVPGLALSLTYFKVDYKNRIERGGPATGPQDIFLEEDRWGAIINRNPDLATLQAICSSPTFFGSLTDCLSSPLPAIVDGRVRNLGVVKVDGFDLNARYDWSTLVGDWGVSLGGTRLLSYKQATTETAPLIDILDTLNAPLSRKIRAEGSWYYNGLSATISSNYQNSYTDHRSTPTRKIDSLTTWDIRLAYRTGSEEGVDGTEFALAVNNVFDKDPPLVNTLFGYDQLNADPIGRVVSFQVTKSW